MRLTVCKLLYVVIPDQKYKLLSLYSMSNYNKKISLSPISVKSDSSWQEPGEENNIQVSGDDSDNSDENLSDFLEDKDHKENYLEGEEN